VDRHRSKTNVQNVQMALAILLTVAGDAAGR